MQSSRCFAANTTLWLRKASPFDPEFDLLFYPPIDVMNGNRPGSAIDSGLIILRASDRRSPPVAPQFRNGDGRSRFSVSRCSGFTARLFSSSTPLHVQFLKVMDQWAHTW
jgi:hypothetical protein